MFNNTTRHICDVKGRSRFYRQWDGRGRTEALCAATGAGEGRGLTGDGDDGDRDRLRNSIRRTSRSRPSVGPRSPPSLTQYIREKKYAEKKLRSAPRLRLGRSDGDCAEG